MTTIAWLLAGILPLASIALTANAAGECGNPYVRPITNSTKRPANRIISGWAAKPHSLPWMVYLELDIGDSVMICAGSLVDSGMGNRTDMVVTATHCVYYEDSYQAPGKISAVVGAHNIDIVEDSFVYLGIRNYVSYYYNYDTDDNDITVLRLSEAVMYTKYVSPICIATKSIAKMHPSTCFAAGWGKTKKGGYSTILKMTRLMVLPSSNCTYTGRKKRALCARNYYRNDLPCMGDSGSPLFCQVDDRYFLFGVLSAGPADCRDVDTFKVHYIKVSAFHDWILESIEKLKTAPDHQNRTEAVTKLLLPKFLKMKGQLPTGQQSSLATPINGMELIAAFHGYVEKRV